MRVWGASLSVAAIGLVVFAAPASATTFCVPGFFDGCPNAGGNQASPSLTAAMSDDGSDGEPDKVLIDAGHFHEPANQQIEASGSDPLEVIGAGKDQTRITADVSGNVFTVRLNDRPGIKVSDLTIHGPVTLGDGNGDGAIAQLKDATLTDVDVVVNSHGADGLALIGDCVIIRTHMEAGEGFDIDYGIRMNGASPGNSVLVDSEIDNATYGLMAVAPNLKLDVILSRISDPDVAAVWIGKGAEMKFQNSVIDTAGQRAFIVQPEPGSTKKTVLKVDSSTIFNVGTAYEPAFEITIPGSVTAGDAEVTVDGSIVRGYDETWELTVPAGPGIPKASLTFDHSNFAPVGSGDVVDADSPTNINEDPLFTSPQDLHLLPGSPSIDAGDPASILTYDFEGAPRPRDGDGNGTSLPDQGAFEFQPTCETVPATCPKDMTAPKVSKVKIRFKRGKGGLLRFRLTENATVKAVFTPIPKKAGKGKKRKVVNVTRRAKQGLNKIKLLKRKLKPGRYRVAITATDQAGNRSKTLKKKFRAT